MATNFPASLDTLTNPTSSDSLSSPSHSAQHANVNDAVEALQAKVGADSSAVTSSLDYKVAQLEALGSWVDFSSSQNIGISNTVGNGTLESYYAVTNDVVHVRGTFTLGSTSAIGGNVDINVPFAPAGTSGQYWTGSVRIKDGTIYYSGEPVLIGSIFRLTYSRVLTVGGLDLIRNGDCSASAPMTWTTGDAIYWSFTYQAA